MKTLVHGFVAAFVFMLLGFTTSAQDTLVTWNFPNNPDDEIADGGTPPNLASIIETRGGTSALDFANAGNTTNCANATVWDAGANTKYWMLSFDATGATSITVSSAQRSGNTGPRNFKLQYTLDTLGSWTDVVAGAVVVANNWLSGVLTSVALPPACDNQPMVYLRWIMTDNVSVTGGTVGSTGVSRIDDIVVEGLTGFVPAYAAIPYFQSFDNTWADGMDVGDIPTINWLNTPSTGNQSWRRNDDLSTWTMGAGGAYTPTGANATAHSARFHTRAAPNGSSGTLDLYVSLNVAGPKTLKYYRINTGGSDYTRVLFSIDGGNNFTPIDTAYNSAVWTLYSVNLGTTTSSTCVIRFMSTSDGGGSDIGIDEVEVSFPPPDDAGIASFVSPSAALSPGIFPVKVNIENYGSDTLVSADIQWSVNGAVQTPFSWTGNLAPGTIEDSISLGSYNFVAGNYQLKSWTESPNGNTDIDNSNDTAYRSSFVQLFAAIPHYENFEAVWINRNDSADVPDNYWLNTPYFGNNSWRRDDEGTFANWQWEPQGAYTPEGALSTSHSARFHSYGATIGQVGSLDLFIDFSAPGAKKLSYYLINIDGNDNIDVLLSTNGGASFTNVGTNTVSTNWTKFTINLGAVSAPNGVIRFRATSDYGNSDIGIDEVSVTIAGPDVAVTDVLQPIGGCSLTSTETIEIEVTNLGTADVTDVPVSFSTGLSSGTDTIAGPITMGSSVTHIFTQTADMSGAGNYTGIFYTSMSTDTDLSNDTMKVQINNILNIDMFPFVEDFESGNDYLKLAGSTHASIGIHTGEGVGGSTGLHFTGRIAGTWPGGSGNSTTANQAWNTYTAHHAFAYTCIVDASTLLSPELKLDLRQNHVANGGPLYSWFRVMLNDTVQLTSTGGISDFNPVTATTDPFQNITFDLLAYAGTSFTLTFQSSCKYDSVQGGVGDNAFIDNIIIQDKPVNDMSATLWLTPAGGNCGMSNAETISIEVKNTGIDDQWDIPVFYSTDNGGNWVGGLITDTLQSGDSLIYVFDTTADFSIPGIYNCIARTELAGDITNYNDTVIFDVLSIPYITSYPYYEDFEGSFSGWSSGSPDATNQWELGTPAKPTINSAHSGVNAWVTQISGNYEDLTNSWVVSPCMDFSSLLDPQLSVWLFISTETDWDAMVMETSLDDITWTQFAGNLVFYNNNSGQGPVTPPKWSGSNGGWAQYKTAMTGFAGESFVRIRFRFESDVNTTDDGIAMDDIFISDPLPENAALVKWISPMSGCGLSASEPVSVLLASVGTDTISNFPISYSVDGGASWTTETVTVSIPAGDTIQFDFAAGADMSAAGLHSCIAATGLTGDLDPTNDSLFVDIFALSNISVIPFTDNLDGTNNYLKLGWDANSFAEFETGSGDMGSTALHFTGLAASTWPGGTSGTTTAADAWGTYLDHHASANTCDITITGTTNLFLKFMLRQSYSSGDKYAWFRVVADGITPLADTNNITDFNPVTKDADTFAWVVYNLTPYIGNTFSLSFQACNKYNDANGQGGVGDNAWVDNIMLFDTTSTISIEERIITMPIFYPNPTNGTLNVIFNSVVADAEIDLYSLNGQLAESVHIDNASSVVLDIGHLPPGLYCLVVKTANGSAVTRIIKQ